MVKLDVRIEFLYPFRIVPRKDIEKRATDRLYMRGGTYAMWHQIKGSLGKPYITGTLVRSALFTELEKILVLHKNLFECCFGTDITKGNFDKPKFLRRRPQYIKEKETCGECPLCLIMGRSDKSRRGEKIPKDKNKKWTGETESWAVHFSNFKESTSKGKEDKGFEWEKTVCRRIANRVDYTSGKAKDYMKIWEVDPGVCSVFEGCITINTSKHVDDIKKMIAVGLAQLNVLAGSVCRIDITNEDHDGLIKGFVDLIKQEPKLKSEDLGDLGNLGFIGEDQSLDEKVDVEESIKKQAYSSQPKFVALDHKADVKVIAKSIEKIVGKNRKDHLRRLADAVRELRNKAYKYDEKKDNIVDKVIKSLPRDKKGKKETIWEWEESDLKIIQVIKNGAKDIEQHTQWRKYCEELGQELYKCYKDAKEKEGETSQERLMGETEYYGLPHRDDSKLDNLPIKSFPDLKWIVSGELKAVTPFFFGMETSENQTSSPILLTKDGSYRLPCSVVRGALRRDLRIVIGDGCDAELGKDICECGVCNIMSNLVIEDSIALCKKPPQVRHRIRLNNHTATVEEGALFDMEAGYQGIVFPFRFYFDTKKSSMDPYLFTVLDYWKNGQAVFGGDVGTGFGRFKLQNVNGLRLNVSKPQKHLFYLVNRGFKGVKNISCSDTSGLKLFDWKFITNSVSLDKLLVKPNKLPWEKVEYTIEIDSPLISRDPIIAMLDERNVDTVMIRKQKKSGKIVYHIKGESIRGLFRSILIKNDPTNEKLYEKDHEDCNCIQCRLFGSTHQHGKLRFEDAEVQNEIEDKKMDHVAIDRFTCGGVDQMKFDEYPLPGSPHEPIILKGFFWIKNDVKDDDKKALENILTDFKDGLMPLGGLGAIGYGHVKNFEIKTNYIKISESSNKKIDCKGHFKGTPIEKITFDKNKIYHPHYFIKPSDKKVDRIGAAELVSHVKKQDHEGNELLSGTITCKLTTKGPIFIPDTENDNYFGMEEPGKSEKEKHKNYGFFRINGKIAIPGSSIRGMVSSVFETLTHSCFRVMDEKKYITRRVIPESETASAKRSGRNRVSDQDKKDDYLAGRVKKNGDKWEIIEMGEIVRLPIYDNLKTISKIKEKDYKKNEGGDNYKKIKHANRYNQKLKMAMQYNKDLAEAAEANRNFIKNLDKTYKDVLKGKKEIYYKTKHQEKNGKIINPNSEYAILVEKQRGAKKGFIKFTGPDMVNVKKDSKNKYNPEFDTWDNYEMDIHVHNEVEKRASQKKEYPRPIIACVKDSVEYRMQKRCERIFADKEDAEEFVIPERIVKQYNDIIKDNKNNTEQIPNIFRSTALNSLSDGDLVYFKKKGNKITSIVPVSISREVDDKPMGKRFPNDNDSLQSCTKTCIEDCEECPGLCEKNKEYFSPHPQGLCPACHLFGTTFYKSRVSFGMAWLNDSKVKWYINTEDESKGGKVTLPLLERPRPTWSMPEKTSTIPGRKFYVHHPWSVDKLKEEKIKSTPNNRTVEPLGKNNEFTFEINFNNLRDWELGLLIYSLELEEDLAHKLGMAKAVGMGSVQIAVESISLKETSGEYTSKISLIERGIKHLKLDEDNMKALQKLLWLPSNNDISVRYPDLEGNEEIPGYTDFLKEEKDPDTKKINPHHMNIKKRLGLLQTPWNNWFPVSSISVQKSSISKEKKFKPKETSVQKKKELKKQSEQNRNFDITNIYVGNINFKSSEAGIRSLFEKYGNVNSVKFIKDRNTGKFRGFGFIEMESNTAQKTIENLNGMEFEGRILRVNEANDKKNSGKKFVK